MGLLVPGVLLVRSARTMQRTELGFAVDQLLKAHLLLPRTTYPDPSARRAAIERVLLRIEQVPGVTAAAGVMPHPFRGNPFAPVECEGCSPADAPVMASPQTVTDAYFRTLGIRLIGGRLFDTRDDSAGLPAAIVSEALARRLWGAPDPIGRRVRRVMPGGAAPWLTVVGVVRDVRKTYTDSVFPDLYRPFAQEPRAYLALMVRSLTPPLAQEQAVREAVTAEDPALALADVEPMAAVVAARRGQTAMLASFVGVAGGVCFLLTIAGLYGVIAYLVRARRRELAVRLALGARPLQVVAMVISESRAMVLTGVGAGVLLALASGRVSRVWRMDLSPHDPATLAAVLAVVVLVVGVALAVPARRAVRTDPAIVLRDE